MPRLDSLPADQRAVLQLMLRQGKSYGDLAGLLRISQDTVRDRAHLALAGLADPGDLSEQRRDEVGDYLLGQQTASQRAGTRSFLDDSAAARGWARALSAELQSLAGEGLPDIPADPAEVEEAFDALDARRAADRSHERSSRVGGLLLLIGLGVAVAVVLVIVLSGGSDDSDKSAVSSTPVTTPATTTTGAQAVAQINMLPPGGGKSPIGVAVITQEGGQLGLAFTATKLEPTDKKNFYALWLATPPSKAKLLGFTKPVGKDGKIPAVISPLPANTASYRQLELTHETSAKPKLPGPIVLVGRLSQ